MKKILNFLMEEHNAGVTAEEMTFKEKFIFSHHYDDDTQIYWRMGVSFNLIASIASLFLTTILVGQKFFMV